MAVLALIAVSLGPPALLTDWAMHNHNSPKALLSHLRPLRRVLVAALSLVVVVALFVGLSQAESRAIYYPFDKWLHASVFFLLWWLARASLPVSALWVTLLVVGLGGAEELRQAFAPGRSADWADMAANTAGAGVAALLYAALRGLWVARRGVVLHADASSDQAPAPAHHAVDWRLELRLWHWRWYVVLLAGSSRRTLSRQQTVVTGWVLGAVLGGVVLLAAALGTAVLMLIAVSLGLGG